ncbi:hypothetical protein PGTUg99_033598 [Puccinia graminis f. sp. tritici]|uniref:Uncharacterized protein n=1 Tax=Puccinia graminis f. sp. tritici TaxID=56615 RepID=A0A5B0S9V2_PUCGR|nr:hypothetical protein PGTUg99_033598 [Puccinia graminis f. sp. tritici]
MVEGYPSRIPVIRWRIPASANGYPPTGADSGADGPFSAKSWRVSGYPKGYPRPEGEMAGWKETLPAGDLLVFQSTRYLYLVDRKGFVIPLDSVEEALQILCKYVEAAILIRIDRPDRVINCSRQGCGLRDHQQSEQGSRSVGDPTPDSEDQDPSYTEPHQMSCAICIGDSQLEAERGS